MRSAISLATRSPENSGRSDTSVDFVLVESKEEERKLNQVTLLDRLTLGRIILRELLKESLEVYGRESFVAVSTIARHLSLI